ncbi:MEDS domain-containing protein [Metabacillus sp. 84]|uniref:MEDS domain-containing protein n=1 Tax=unclassified Metabacillus TaxID=2675274 RepID=UPI003CEAA538
MNHSLMDIKKDIDQYKSGHILFLFDDADIYIKAASAYILSGVEQGDQIIVIENERMAVLLEKQLKGILTKKQLANVHFLNNFDFYYSNGNFHTPTIVAYFLKVVQPLIDANQRFRTWAHIEWGEIGDIKYEIDDYEKNSEVTVNAMKLLSVCAYNKERLPAKIKTSLLNSHRYLMTGNGIIQHEKTDAANE